MIHTSMYSQGSVGVRTHACSLNKARPRLETVAGRCEGTSPTVHTSKVFWNCTVDTEPLHGILAESRDPTPSRE